MSANFATQTGLTILAASSRGYTVLSTTRAPVRTPADIRGVPVAAPDLPVYGRILESLNAWAVPAVEGNPLDPPRPNAGAELLRTKEAVAVLAPLWTADSRRWYLAQSNYALVDLTLEETFLVVNTAFFTGLDAGQQAALSAAARRAQDALRVTAQLLNHALRFNALESVSAVTTPAYADLNAFRDATRDTAAWLGEKQVGEPLVQRFLAAISPKSAPKALDETS
jgi:TRAP-type C4-dicarboxylate transport system substrate-binding protein